MGAQVQSFCSVTKSCPTLCDPTNCSMPGLPVLHSPWSLLKLMSTEWMMPSNHLILCRPLLLLPSIFPSITVFSNELALCFRWPKYRSFSFSISSSDENSTLMFFRIGLISLQFKGFSSLFSSTTVWKHQFFGVQPSLWSNSHIHTWLLEKS